MKPRPALPSLRRALMAAMVIFGLGLVGLVGGGMLYFMQTRLNAQFETRLLERSELLRDRFSDASTGLGEMLPPEGNNLMAIVDEHNTIILSPSNDFLILPIGGAFTLPLSGEFTLGDRPFRAVSRPLEGFFSGQTLWVALPSWDVNNASRLALQIWLASLVFTLLIALLLARWLTGRLVGGLGQAADETKFLFLSAEKSSAQHLSVRGQYEEVAQLTEAINEMLQRLQQQKEDEERFLGQITHEFGAPLTVIMDALDKYARDGQTPATERLLHRAERVAKDLRFASQDLINFTRGNMEIEVMRFLLTAADLRARLEHLVPGCTYEGDWNVQLLGDPDRLVQALRNLAANARRAAGGAGMVTVAVAEEGEEICFTVRDNGPGLPSELGQRIFEPHVSGSNSTGLGLSVARQVAEKHGGSLRGENHPEGGAIFRLVLPALRWDDEEEIDEIPEMKENEA